MNRGGEPQIENDKALVPANDTSLSRRSIEITRTYIDRGHGVTRSMWISIRPRNPILKAVMAVPAAALMLGMLVLMMALAGFALLAMALMMASSNRPRTNSPTGSADHNTP